MPEHIPIVVNKNIYSNVRAAWQAESPAELPEITVRKRLNAGWHPQDAFMLPSIEPQLRRKGHGTA